jgi:hypothetical protein
VVTGYYQDTSGNYDGFVETLSGAGWSATTLPTTGLSPASNSSTYMFPESVSCTSSSSCVVTGYYQDISNNYDGFVETLSGAGWSAATLPTTGLSPASNSTYMFPSSVSCISSSSCVVTGSYQNTSGNYDGFVETLSGAGWSATTLPTTGLSPASNLSTYMLPNSVSCTSSSSCVVTGYYRDTSNNTDGFVETLSGTGWSAATLPTTGLFPASNLTHMTPNSVSCTSSSSCVVTGSYQNTSGNYDGFVESESAPATQPPSTPPSTPTTTTLAGPTSVAVGAQVILTATISSVSGPASGTVTFSSNGSAITSCSDLPLDPFTGTVSCTTTFGTSGSESVVASFNGTSLYKPSESSPLAVTVGPTTPPTTTPPTTTPPTTTPPTTTPPTTTPPTSPGRTAPGYILITPTGGVTAYGSAPQAGSLPDMGITPAFPIVGDAMTPDGQGYWLVGSDGGVFAFGNAGFYGSTAAMKLDAPIVGITPTPDGQGYWLVASDGGVFTFGDAGFYGSTGGTLSSIPVVGLAATTNGHGYWIVRSNGQVMAFGDAPSSNTVIASTQGPITSIASDPTGTGFWVVTSSGLVIGCNGAPSLGSLTGIRLAAPIIRIVPTADGNGYWLIGADNGVFAFGDAPFLGSGA